MPGNFTIVEGDREVQEWLVAEPGRIDDWLYELVDEVSFFAAGRLREHAPGHIDQLVDIKLATELEVGHFEAIAGVEPEITPDTFGRGLGSDPADFPVFVDQGTGVFGEVGTPIETIPGHVMAFMGRDGHMVFTPRVAGQRPQHFSLHSFEDTVGWLPARIEFALRDLGRRSR